MGTDSHNPGEERRIRAPQRQLLNLPSAPDLPATSRSEGTTWITGSLNILGRCSRSAYRANLGFCNMKHYQIRLKGVAALGLPDPTSDRPNQASTSSPKKKIAARAGPQSGDRKRLQEATAKPLRIQCSKAPHLASVSLAACLIDERHSFGEAA
jgi:hypothetical protein